MGAALPYGPHTLHPQPLAPPQVILMHTPGGCPHSPATLPGWISSSGSPVGARSCGQRREASLHRSAVASSGPGDNLKTSAPPKGVGFPLPAHIPHRWAWTLFLTG